MTLASVSTPIDIPFPEIDTPHLHIVAMACFLEIRPGDAEPWVRGTYRDPGGHLALHTIPTADGTEIRLATDIADLFGLVDGPPRLDLSLGTARPFRLSIDSGASETRFEFGGIPLRRLEVNEGAGRATLAFSAPNPVQMERLRLGIGAGAVEASGLSNAAFDGMRVEGGAAGVQLTFSGTLRVTGQVEIATALSGVDLALPAGVAAEVTWTSMWGPPAADAGFVRRNDTLYTQAAADGTEPKLRIHNAAALGGLRLRTL